MFAEDVSLLPEKSFKDVLQRCLQDPSTFEHDVGQLWEAMDVGGYAHAIRKKVARFNGAFFARRTVLPLGREEIGELRQAASYDWRNVDPSIFGTLLEQALDPEERRRLGAHYTPRAYVERLVVATLIEPLRAEWANVLATIERKKGEIAALAQHDPRRGRASMVLRVDIVQDHNSIIAARTTSARTRFSSARGISSRVGIHHPASSRADPRFSPWPDAKPVKDPQCELAASSSSPARRLRPWAGTSGACRAGMAPPPRQQPERCLKHFLSLTPVVGISPPR